MKKCMVVVLVVLTGFYIFGCGKKEAAMEEPQAIMTMEGLSTVGPVTPATSQPIPTASLTPTEARPQGRGLASDSQSQKLPLPPGPPYKPTDVEVQTALKNAGYYAGEIDGKIGPMTKKAIKDFQQANNLQADGKVGLKTWTELSKHLNPPTTSIKIR